MTLKPPATLTRWLGALEGRHDDVLVGWAVDRQDANARVVLEIRLAGATIGTVVADVARTDLAALLHGALGPESDACHGFIADLRGMCDRIDGVLTVHVANAGWTLPGSVDSAAAAASPATSHVFGEGGLRLQGWAPPAFPGAGARTVRAYVGADLLAEARADVTLPFLRGHVAERHGFQLDLPPALADGRPHSVHVVDQDGQPLGGSPLAVCCHAEGALALVDDAPALLRHVIDDYERHLPRGLGLAHYAAWAARFEDPSEAPATGSLRIAIIVVDCADEAAAARSVASLHAQRGGAPRIFIAAAGGFAPVLATALASGCDAIGVLRGGDTLAPHALACAAAGFDLAGAQLVYTDSEAAGRPWFKPAWNPDYALASDYPLDLMLVRTDALRAACAAAPGAPADAAQLAWAALAHLWPDGERAIVHVPRVLYRYGAPLSAIEHAARHTAAAEALARIAPGATLTALDHDAAAFAPRRVDYPLTAHDRARRVTLIIPTRDRIDLLRRCLDSIARHTNWPALDLLVVDNGSVLPASKRYLRALARRGVTVLAQPGPFNYAALNNAAVAVAGGEIVGLINNDIEALHDGWLDAMVAELLRPGVGAVGAKLLWPNGMVQHGGVLLGLGNVAGHFGNDLADADWGDHGRNQLAQQVGAVTAACLLMRKTDYEALGGMDAQAFPVAFNDVDLCLKLRAAGKAIVWTPAARLLHAESASRGSEDTPQKRSRARREIDQLRRRWGPVLLRDPAYHPSLSLDALSLAFGGLALPPRPRGPRRAGLSPDEEAHDDAAR